MIRFHLKRLMADHEARTGARLTMERLAAETGIYRTTLSKIGGPAPYNTTTDNIDALCRFFECNVGELVEFVDDRKSTADAGEPRSSARSRSVKSRSE